MWDTIINFLSNPTLWLGLGICGLVPALYAVLKKFGINKLPGFKTRKNLLIVSVLGLLFTTGMLGTLFNSTGSLSSGSWAISDLQVTTDFQTDAGGSVTESSNVDDLMDLRFTDAQANESTGVYELDTGILTVRRVGDLSADSCIVKAIVPGEYEHQSTPDGTRYSIIEKTALGEYEVYVEADDEATAATTNSPKESDVLSFDEGEAVGYVSVILEVDEDGHDALNQYNYKDVVLDVCGKPYTFRVHRM